jgi:hypothetical protein
MERGSVRNIALALAALASISVTPVFATSYVTATSSQVMPPDTQATVTAICPVGYSVTGGGYKQINAVAEDGGAETEALGPANLFIYFAISYVYVWWSMPNDDGTGWTVRGTTNYITPGTLTVYARCASS